MNIIKYKTIPFTYAQNFTGFRDGVYGKNYSEIGLTKDKIVGVLVNAVAWASIWGFLGQNQIVVQCFSYYNYNTTVDASIIVFYKES